VDPTVSLSRVMDSVVTLAHRDAARRLRALVAHYEAKRDLVLLGGYTPGSDKALDEALARMPKIEQFLAQSPDERVALEDTVALLTQAIT
jgi:flagellar biosynthesis/type III secretory pathway ATPase